jgi:hypothetical protein
MHKRYSAIVLCCAAAALAGCGSSNSGSSASNPSGTGAANTPVFEAALNQLCQSGNAAVAKAGSNTAKLSAVLGQYLPKFKALTTSGTLEVSYQKFLADIEAEVAALHTGNRAAIVAAAAKTKAAASNLGAPACAK